MDKTTEMNVPESFSPLGGHGRRKILVDFHPYGYETSIFSVSSRIQKGHGATYH